MNVLKISISVIDFAGGIMQKWFFWAMQSSLIYTRTFQFHLLKNIRKKTTAKTQQILLVYKFKPKSLKLEKTFPAVILRQLKSHQLSWNQWMINELRYSAEVNHTYKNSLKSDSEGQ